MGLRSGRGSLGGRLGWLALVAAVTLVAGGCGPGRPSKPQEIVLGLMPSVDAGTLQEKAGPLAELLARELGVPVRTFVAANYAGLVEAMGSAKVDVTFIPPLAYVLANEENGTQVVLKAVRNGTATYRSQILVAAGSPYRSLGELRGKRFAFTDPASTSGYMFAHLMLREAGVDPQRDLRAVFAGGHDKAIIALYQGEVDAAATFEDARVYVEKTYPDVFRKTRVLAYSEPIPNDTVAVRPGLDPEWRDRIVQAFLALTSRPDGQQALKDLYRIEGFERATDADYEVVRRAVKALQLDLSVIR